ncbi:Uncharacterised protein [Escherichia coli]|nr:Uncharacterised protein [Escherichia coli]SRY12771.1 Uncharacterised protein [Escherichia coli]
MMFSGFAQLYTVNFNCCRCNYKNDVVVHADELDDSGETLLKREGAAGNTCQLRACT